MRGCSFKFCKTGLKKGIHIPLAVMKAVGGTTRKVIHSSPTGFHDSLRWKIQKEVEQLFWPKAEEKNYSLAENGEGDSCFTVCQRCRQSAGETSKEKTHAGCANR